MLKRISRFHPVLKYRYKLNILIVLVIIFSGHISWSQSPDYQVLFGNDWAKATGYEQENRHWIEPLLAKNNIPYPLAISIVFPELVRFSALSDKMETVMLKTLYVNLGDEYADFSIGVFQMKPSFAEEIREQSVILTTNNPDLKFKRKTDYSDINEFRKSIVKDLEDPQMQVRYLIAFIDICNIKFGIFTKDEYSQVRFLATAYNAGFNKSTNAIEALADKKYFSTKPYKSTCYSYSDVSLFWYRKYSSSR